MKRKRGGQQGNQNARKHGFYSGAFNAEQLSEFWRLVAAGKLPPELAAMRVKLASALQANPGDRRIIRDAARLLAAWLSEREQLDRQEAEAVRRCFVQLFQSQASSPSSASSLVEGLSEWF